MYAVILAGGTGERFWPLSRRENPKQFLSLFGSRTMLQLTMDKLENLAAPSDVYVITDEIYREQVQNQLPELPAENIICEPCGRDTAAAVGLAAAYIQRRDPEGVMLVLPADHYVADIEAFQRVIRAGEQAASSGEWVVTIGIIPSRPETGYGYIEKGEAAGEVEGVSVFKTLAFHEKPDVNKALEYLEKGNYLWNSGMFIWRTDLLRRLIARFLPELDRGLAIMDESLGSQVKLELIREVYAELPRVSIDYGIMEKCEEVLVIPGAFGWDDIGTWTALGRYRKTDQQGNVLESRGVFIDTNGCLVYAPKQVVVTLGVANLLIVNHGGSLLVCNKNRAQDIKKAVEALKEAGYEDII